MAKYLDPKAGVTFKKVFGEHKNLVISLLNALLPLDDGKQVESIEYLPPEMVPDNPDKKNSCASPRVRWKPTARPWKPSRNTSAFPPMKSRRSNIKLKS